MTIGNHVYHIRLKQTFQVLAPVISSFLNSRTGQAIIRKRIAGGTTPTIRTIRTRIVHRRAVGIVACQRPVARRPRGASEAPATIDTTAARGANARRLARRWEKLTSSSRHR
jgi:hypothetical protein